MSFVSFLPLHDSARERRQPQAGQGQEALQRAPAEEPVFHATGIFIWEAFIGLNDLDRQLWLGFIWRRRCRCSLASETGLSDQQIRARLRETARYLDEVLHLRGLGGMPSLRRPSLSRSEVIGPSRRRLDAQMRRREACSCRAQVKAKVSQSSNASCA